MTATHSQTDRYKHKAFSRWERCSLRVQKTERTKDKHSKSTLSVLFTAKHPFCSSVHLELKTVITVLTSTLSGGWDIEPSPNSKQKPKISLLYMAVTAKNYHRLWCFFTFLSLSLSCVLQHSSSILFFCLSTAGNDSVSPPCPFFPLFPLCFAPLGRRWQELVFHKLFSGFHIMSGHSKTMLHLSAKYNV